MPVQGDNWHRGELDKLRSQVSDLQKQLKEAREAESEARRKLHELLKSESAPSQDEFDQMAKDLDAEVLRGKQLQQELRDERSKCRQQAQGQAAPVEPLLVDRAQSATEVAFAMDSAATGLTRLELAPSAAATVGVSSGEGHDAERCMEEKQTLADELGKVCWLIASLALHRQTHQAAVATLSAAVQMLGVRHVHFLLGADTPQQPCAVCADAA